MDSEPSVVNQIVEEKKELREKHDSLEAAADQWAGAVTVLSRMERQVPRPSVEVFEMKRQFLRQHEEELRNLQAQGQDVENAKRHALDQQNAKFIELDEFHGISMQTRSPAILRCTTEDSNAHADINMTSSQHDASEYMDEASLDTLGKAELFLQALKLLADVGQMSQLSPTDIPRGDRNRIPSNMYYAELTRDLSPPSSQEDRDFIQKEQAEEIFDKLYQGEFTCLWAQDTSSVVVKVIIDDTWSVSNCNTFGAVNGWILCVILKTIDNFKGTGQSLTHLHPSFNNPNFLVWIKDLRCLSASFTDFFGNMRRTCSLITD
jgi:hypothetical protein